MQIPVFTVDAFTKRAFCGNPAAVCLLENIRFSNLGTRRIVGKEQWNEGQGNVLHSLGLVYVEDLDEDLHQKIATEMNLSETAFIRKLQPGDDFTNKNTNPVLTFVTLSGELKARQAKDHIVLDLPLYSTSPQVLEEVGELIKAAVGDLIVQDVRYSPDTKNLLVCLSDTYERSVLEELNVSAQGFLSAEKTGKVKGLILTLKGSSSGKGHDFYSRYFAPWYGVLEDPVTGSAHAVLSSYWSEKLGKKEMLAFQCSRRGGELRMSLRSDGRVDIAGQTAVVFQGHLTL